jgi:alpha-tubulin suppressor-like RCC1 family protein
VVPGGFHTCGLTAVGSAYCWGLNLNGTLGTGTSGDQHAPAAVTGGHTFQALAAGTDYTCGLASGQAWCWGNGNDAPVLVPGGLTFTAISAGLWWACGLTAAGAAHCWGFNGDGQLGSGNRTTGPDPVAVSGGLTFQTIQSGGRHVCGVTTGGIGYCWGQDGQGQIGHGAVHLIPVPVVGGVVFGATRFSSTR